MTSAPQKAKIATTFAQRVTLIQVFGLTDTEDDVDGQMPGNGGGYDDSADLITEAQADELENLALEVNANVGAFLAFISTAWGCTEPLQHLGQIPVTHFNEAKAQLERKRKK
jgi:hypothetical protein